MLIGVHFERPTGGLGTRCNWQQLNWGKQCYVKRKAPFLKNSGYTLIIRPSGKTRDYAPLSKYAGCQCTCRTSDGQIHKGDTHAVVVLSSDPAVIWLIRVDISQQTGCLQGQEKFLTWYSADTCTWLCLIGAASVNRSLALKLWRLHCEENRPDRKPYHIRSYHIRHSGKYIFIYISRNIAFELIIWWI